MPRKERRTVRRPGRGKREEVMEKKEDSLGALEAAVAAAKLAGRLLKTAAVRFGTEIGNELKEMAKQGAHELGSVLYTGSAYVQYARDDTKKKEPEKEPPQQKIEPPERERGGREM
jgi:hypothetical protein